MDTEHTTTLSSGYVKDVLFDNDTNGIFQNHLFWTFFKFASIQNHEWIIYNNSIP